jgi:methionyl-tRNA formyltransferase
MNFVFVGGTFRGFELFNALIEKNRIPKIAFVLQEDDHETDNYSVEILNLATAYHIPVHCKKKLNNNDYEQIRKLSPDCMLVCGWRTIIDPAINDSLKYGMFAAHDSLLPRYRGFAPTNWAMINGEKTTGVTLFRINDGEVDSGEVFGQKELKIMDSDFAYDMVIKVTHATVELFLEFLENMEHNRLKGYKQDEALASYTCKRTPNDGRINWNKSSWEIYNLIRALTYPFPGSFCEYDGEQFTITKARLGEKNHLNFIGVIPGRVLSLSKNGVEVMCSSGTLFLEEWELRGSGLVECPSKRIKSITNTLS